MTRNQDQFAPVVGERVVKRESGSLNARQAIEPLLDIAIHRGQLLQRVSRWGAVQLHEDATGNLESKVLALEIAQAAREHR
jgi:hypothetical protein